MKNKKFIISLLLVALCLFSLSLVSAAGFDFFTGHDDLYPTTLNCYPTDHGCLVVELNTSSSEALSEDSSNRTIYINVTDENNHTKHFEEKFLTNSFLNDDNTSISTNLSLDPGTYNVSMYYPGDDVFNASSFNAKVTLEPRTDFSENNTNGSSGNSSTEIVSTETIHDGNLTTIITTYADGHTKNVTKGS
ncbi:hypothetical protein [Methanobrevibacter sp.]